MPDQSLFAPIDITARTSARAAEFKRLVAGIDSLTHAPEPPAARLIPHCRRCPLFASCTGAGIRHPLFELPHMTLRQLESFLQRGYRAVTDIPEPAQLTERQSTVWQSITTGRPLVTSNLRGILDAVAWPTHYLDFETVATAVPLFHDLAPREQLPYLYSIRTCDRPGKVQRNRAFLSPHERDGSREMAEHLLQDLAPEGSIIVYSGNEIRTIRSLARRYPDLATPLRHLLPRTIRLESVLRRSVYHPGFRGSTSLKSVVSALIPGFT